MRHWLWLSLLVVLLDQASKWLVLGRLEPYQVVEVVPHVDLTLLFNSGAAFSLLADAGGWQRWLFALFAATVSAALVIWLLRLRRGQGLLALALALLLGGALGNLIDRLLFGHVVDFIRVSLPFIPLRLFNPWPAFNVADSAITLGVALLLFETFRAERSPAT